MENPVFSLVFSGVVDGEVVHKLNDKLEELYKDHSKNIISVTQSTCYDDVNEDVVLTICILYEVL